MSDRSAADVSRPDETVSFGDVSPSVRSTQGSVAEAESGLQDSARSLGQEAEVTEGDDAARGITRERAPRAQGDVDTTPVSQQE